MWPWRTGVPDDNLIHHFEVESLEDRSSNFVSTTSSLEVAVEHAAALARPNSEEPFDEDFVIYIYVIRPDLSFFDVDASLIYARDQSPENSSERERLNNLIRDYTGMDEVVSWGGFIENRIMSYAELNGRMLQRYGANPGSPLFSQEFWASRWIPNNNYNPEFNSDTSNTVAYTSMSNPRGFVTQVANGTQPPVSLSFTCMGINSGFPSFLKAGKDEPVCPQNQYLNIKRVIYDKNILTALF